MNDPRTNRDRLGMMTQPRFWPNWPTLPIKNKRDRKPGEFPRLGVLIELGLAEEGGTPDIRFIEGNMFMIGEAEIKNSKKADCRQLIADGWEVD